MTEVENGGRVPEELRSVGQLNMLHSFAVRLNSLRDVGEIGGAIAALPVEQGGRVPR
jgi:hypothetical protein